MSSTTGTNCPVKAANDILMWTTPPHSASIFGGGLVALYLLYSNTLLGLVSNGLFFATSIACLWVLIKNVINAFQQQQGQTVQAQHPFQFALDSIPNNFNVSEDMAMKIAPKIAGVVNCFISSAVKLVLVDSWANSMGLVVVLYLFRGMLQKHELLCLISYAWIAAFTVPWVYKFKQAEIDAVLVKITTPLKPHMEKVQGMINKFKQAKTAQPVEEKDE